MKVRFVKTSSRAKQPFPAAALPQHVVAVRKGMELRCRQDEMSHTKFQRSVLLENSEVPENWNQSDANGPLQRM